LRSYYLLLLLYLIRDRLNNLYTNIALFNHRSLYSLWFNDEAGFQLVFIILMIPGIKLVKLLIELLLIQLIEMILEMLVKLMLLKSKECSNGART